MALVFTNVKLLQYSHTPVLFEAGLRYRIEKKFTITGHLSHNAYAGSAPMFALEQQILLGATDYEDIILNGISFGSGKIDNISFAGGTMAHAEDYTYSITCYEDGDLFNATSGVYQGLTFASAKDIEELTETFDFEESDTGEKTYNHAISVRYTNYSSVAAGIALAKALAAVFFNATSGLGAFLNSYANIGAAKKVYTENYNLVNCSASFTETAVIPPNNAGVYAYSLSYSLQLDEEGFVGITETCQIRGLSSPKFAGAAVGLTALTPGSFTRSQDVYANYGFSSATLFSQPVNRNVTLDKFTGTITLVTEYSNNPKYQTNAIWEYTIEIVQDQDGYYTITESGTITGYGQPLLSKFQSANDFYSTTVNPNAIVRATALYTSVSGRTLGLIQIKSSVTQNVNAGTIGYSIAHTDNNLYSAGAIKKIVATISLQNPVHLTQKYNVFNFKEVIQPQNQSTLAEIDYSVNYQGKRGTAISTYLAAAKAFVNANLPATTDRYIDSCQYSFHPQDNSFDFSLKIIYVGTHKLFTNISLD